MAKNMDFARTDFKTLVLAAILGAAMLAPSGANASSVNGRARVAFTRCAAVPQLGRAYSMGEGVTLYQVILQHSGLTTRVWIYLPRGVKAGSSKKMPCVVVAPAGTRGFHGMDLGNGDMPEQLPYARSGSVVVAYSISGVLPDNPNSAQLVSAARVYKQAQAGVLNAKAALDYALLKIAAIDRRRVFSAGHSSAATLSLQFAAREPRLRGCIAYAPVCNTPVRVGNRFLHGIELYVPGFRSFLSAYSPSNNTRRLRCPVFLFHADDDSNVPTVEVASYARLLRRTNAKVSFVRVARGNHYQSMRDQGIPSAIQWMRRFS